MAVRRCGAAAAVECFEASDDRSKETEILLVTAAATSHANKSVIRDEGVVGRTRIQATSTLPCQWDISTPKFALL